MTLQLLDAKQTSELLPFTALCEHLRGVAREYARGEIFSPERQVLPLSGNSVLLSMPATARDVAVHKLVNFVPANQARNLPTIRGVVAVYSAITGEPLLLLDGPTVTARRTAAVSMVGVQALAVGVPTHFAVIGIGAQASGHLEALAAMYPGAQVDVHGRDPDKTARFCQQHNQLPLTLNPRQGRVHPDTQVVITVTSSTSPIYSEPVTPERLLIGVGAFKPDMVEFAPACVKDSQLYVDDPVGAPHEAGDLIQAGVDWSTVSSLAQALDGKIDVTRPRLFKSVGCAAWDLAAGRCAAAVSELANG
ncbi:bifunctional Delta(1)-pyrroline-2-carboxylate/Delta(1)-piperideine-2-carboxylate reductase [Pseudomonas sp. CR3202]|uniref:bifunctional Delta(1)-pyrroline-2-carboxylate/Delta(1)-piperideine-2- carboxylate reductase n=1 Tax=Pseudomonas sp. CR3202 TaxID=3351532 RepID=UPI003BF42F17